MNNEPVVACPPSNLYKFQKLVRRNKVAFAAGAGDFTKAIAVEKEAINLLSNEAARQDCVSRLKLYESGAPYREHE